MRKLTKLTVTSLVLSLLMACGRTGTDPNVNSATGATNSISNTNQNHAGGGGTSDGGGGQGVSCTGSAAKLSPRLMLRDLYERRNLLNKNLIDFPGANDIDPASGTEPKLFANEELIRLLGKHFGPAIENLPFGKATDWNVTSNPLSILKVKFIDEKSFLLAVSQDAFSPVNFPAECQIVQLAYWTDDSGVNGDGTLYVDLEKWDQLDQLNKIALLAHEYFYKQARVGGIQNSDRIRSEIGDLFSVEGPKTLFPNWVPSRDPRVSGSLPDSMNGFKYCIGRSSADSAASLQLYEYEGDDKLQHLTIPNLTSSNLNLDGLGDRSLKFDPNDSNMAMTSDLFLLRDQITYPHQETSLDTLPFPAFDLSDDQLEFDIASLGLIRTPMRGWSAGNENLMQRFLDIGLAGPVVWTGSFMNQDSPVTVQVLNPISDQDPREMLLKDQTTLIRLIQSEIESSLNKARIDNSTVRTNQYSLLSVLIHEIESAIACHATLSEFPKWKAALSQYSADTKISPVLIDNGRLNAVLPTLLFRVKTLDYTFDDVFRVLGFSAVVGNNDKAGSKILPKNGRIRIQKRNREITFDLSCEPYSEILSRKTKISPEPQNIARPHIKSESPYTFAECQFAESAAGIRLRSILEVVTGRTNGVFSPLDSHEMDDLPSIGFPNFNLIKFKFLLSRSEEFAVKSCADVDEQLIRQNTQDACAVLVFKHSQDVFLVQFSENLDPQTKQRVSIDLHTIVQLPESATLKGDRIVFD